MKQIWEILIVENAVCSVFAIHI